jgi:hypothetical protein
MVKPGHQPSKDEDFGLVHTSDSDLPARANRKGVGVVRKTAGWVLLLVLLVAFGLVMRHRILHPQIRYVKSREEVLDESLAAAHAGAVGHRARPARRTKVAERNKAVAAYNAIEDACAEAVGCWSHALGGLPSGTITPEAAVDAKASFGGRSVQLDAADKAIEEMARQAEFIKEASRAPGRDGTSLSALYAAARNLESCFRTQSRTYRDVVRIEREFFEGAAARSHGDCASADDALRGCHLRLEEQRADADRAAEQFHAAANRVFD